MFGRSKGSETEKRLVDETAAGLSLVGFSVREAREAASALVKVAKQKLTQAGRASSMYNTGTGDDLLAFETKDKGIKAFLDIRRKHGATDEDIRRWHNLCELERVLLLDADSLMITSTFTAAKGEGQSEEAAAKLAAKVHPRFTHNAEQIGQQGAKDLLPAELKLRVNDYRSGMISHDEARLKRELDEAGDFNALVRSKLAKDAL